MDLKKKKIELALSFVQKLFFVKKNTFFLQFSRIATPWSRKKLLLKFSFLEVTLRP